MDYSLPASSVHSILQERILEWIAIPFCRESSWSRDWTWVSCMAGRFFTIRVTKQAIQFSSLQFSHSVMSDIWRPHGLQHARLPCPSPTPRDYSNSCPLSQWCPSNHLILCYPLLLPPSIIPSIRVFSSESVLCIRWPKDWSFSFSISPSKDYSGLIYFRIDWLDSLLSKGLSRVFSNTTIQKHQLFSIQLSL